MKELKLGKLRNPKFCASIRLCFCVIVSALILAAPAFAQESYKVGIATVLSGDLSVIGQNIVKSIETYKKHRLRHPIEFIFEDSKLSGADGLRAYKALIDLKKVQLLIGGSSSNGTLAGAPLANSSKTVLATPLTGGSNIDKAGEYVFRLGNSDILNGYNESEYFLEKGIKRVAVFTEQTDYTQDISKHFREHFLKNGGEIVFDRDFLPGTIDFALEAKKIFIVKPQAILMPTQTGTALGLFLKKLAEFGKFSGEIHTSFVAAPNPEARTIAGDLLNGVYYMAPKYDEESSAWKEYLAVFQKDHGKDPDIQFHTAGVVDILDLFQSYLDKHKDFNREGFKDFLLQVKDYHGLMGTFSFDKDGNALTGFKLARIE